MTILFLVLISMAIVGGHLNSTPDPYNTMIILSAMAEICLLYFIMTALPFFVRRKSPTIWKIKGKSICKWNILIGLLVLMIIDVIKMGGIYDKVFQNMGENLIYALMFYYINTRSLAKKKMSPDKKIDSTVTGNWDISGQDVMYVEKTTVPEVPLPVASTAEVSTSQPQNSQPEQKEKVRYCSKCGNIVDSQTKKCTGCGKQYFKGIPWKSVRTIAVALLLVGSIAGNIVLYNENSKLEKEKTELTDNIIELKKSNATLNNRAERLTENNIELEKNNQSLQRKLRTAENDIALYNKYVALVVDDGTRLYHKYGCDVLDKADSYWCYGYSDSTFKQYKPCPLCYGD